MATGAGELTLGGERPREGPVRLAHEAAFKLGPLVLEPALRQIRHEDGREEIVEPRVMQVLVALVRSRGAILSRDELITSCWDGRIVGEDAINRVMSRLRRVAETLGAGVFHVETLTKVGYRLVRDSGVVYTPAERGPEAATEPPVAAPAGGGAEEAHHLNRRLLLGTMGVSILGVGGAALWWPRGGGITGPKAEAAAWYEKGVETREQGQPDLYPQAEANFRQAVLADPDFSEAWGALALAYADSVFIEQGNEQVAAAERAQSAARTALRLDPDSLEAQAALLFIPSEFGVWSERQAGLRQLLERRPKSDYLEWLLRIMLAHSFSECGRCREALAVSRTVAAVKPLLPATWAAHVYCLWAAGELAEAESESQDKVSRWPSHVELWVLRMALLTYSGRPAEALAFASAGWRPPYINSEGRIERWRATAQALASNRPDDIELAGRLHLGRIANFHQDMLPAARFFTATGQLDIAFEILDAYYFDRGRYKVEGRPPRTPLTRLNTISLFWPPMGPACRDHRFDRVAEEIGLLRYWRETGSVPDYRQA